MHSLYHLIFTLQSIKNIYKNYNKRIYIYNNNNNNNNNIFQLRK